MARRQVEKFRDGALALACPVCGGDLRFDSGELACARNHRFNVSRKGTVNFLARPKAFEGYDEDFFESRRIVLEAGVYDHVLAGVQATVDNLPCARRIADVGCGEGYYAKGVCAPGRTVYGLDIAKDAIAVAARGGNDVRWLVADLAALPFRAHSLDCILNVFTPAHYAQFERALTPDGTLLKAIPGPAHLRELRHAFRDLIRHEEYENDRIVDHCARHFDLAERIPLTRTVPLTLELFEHFVRMTPLLFGVDRAVALERRVNEITIDAELLVCHPRKRVLKAA